MSVHLSMYVLVHMYTFSLPIFDIFPSMSLSTFHLTLIFTDNGFDWRDGFWKKHSVAAISC